MIPPISTTALSRHYRDQVALDNVRRVVTNSGPTPGSGFLRWCCRRGGPGMARSRVELFEQIRKNRRVEGSVLAKPFIRQSRTLLRDMEQALNKPGNRDEQVDCSAQVPEPETMEHQ
jgi:hypothetical protein